jgi:plasmid stability protein
MASLTLKDMPGGLLDRLRQRAARDRRSLTQEAFVLLEQALGDEERQRQEAAASQAQAWSVLAAAWRSDRSAREEIQEVYKARTGGREVSL